MTSTVSLSSDKTRRMRSSPRRVRVALLIASVAAGLTLVACDPAISITFENQTDHQIRVDVRGNFEAVPFFDTVDAGETRTLDYLSRNRDAYRVVIVNESGGTVLDEIFTIDELEARGRRFVVDDQGIQEDSDASPEVQYQVR